MVANRLTNLQLELLKIFRYELSEDQLSEIRQLLANYLAESATAEMDKLWDERGWTEDTMRELARTHLRTPYNVTRTTD